MGSRQNYVNSLKGICKSIIQKGFEKLIEEFKDVYIDKKKAITAKHGDLTVKDSLDNYKGNNIDEPTRKILFSVIDKIRDPHYRFSSNDISDLVLFNKKIDFVISQCQYITNIFHGENNYVKNHDLDIVALFNDIKSSSSISEFIKNTKIDSAFIKDLNFKSFIIYLFAVVKNLESNLEFPLYYKFYQNIAKYFFNIERLDYDKFCSHFRKIDIRGEKKALEFNIIYNLLAENLKQELELNNMATKKEDKNWLQQKLFNLDTDLIEKPNSLVDSIENNFEEYLKRNVSISSVKKYLGAVSFVNEVSERIGVGEMYTWQLNDIENNKEILFSDTEFINKNSTGNNMYSVAVNHFHKFLQELELMNDTVPIKIPPVIPFEEFKWRWAVTTPSESINSPEIIIGVLKILNKHNGAKHTTQSFQDDLLNLQSSINSRIDLAKVNRGLNKNIIENSGQYWKALGLLNNSTGAKIELSEVGIALANGNISKDEFIKNLYAKFSLPNLHIENSATIRQWQVNNLKVYPIKLIFDILLALKQLVQSPTSWFLTPEELKTVIIPLSIYPTLPLKNYIDELKGYRKNPENYASWPNCTPADNDFRMVKEYLLFLNNFGYLECLELKDNSKRYYLNSNSLALFGDNLEINTSINAQSFEKLDLDFKSFHSKTIEAGLKFSEKIISRFLASLCAKPFVICSGLSGSGKTKLAQSFVQWICESEEQYKIVPVGADWTNREPLLGFPNGLDPKSYVSPDSSALHLITKALTDGSKPYFLILDEMNLSHVERYFADFLSIMESKDKIKLYSGVNRLDSNNNKIDNEVSWPNNLFIIGTVNIDETTYMFSPKVLDRANVIEFRISEKEIEEFLEKPINLDMDQFIDQETNRGHGSNMAADFLNIAQGKANNSIATKDILVLFFKELKKSGAEFGYRSASEINRLISVLKTLTLSNNTWDDKSIQDDDLIDIAIMQKLLPKLHGSRSKLTKVLPILGGFCLKKKEKLKEDYFEQIDNIKFLDDDNIKYKISFEKICRMYKNAIENGYASYAEA